MRLLAKAVTTYKGVYYKYSPTSKKLYFYSLNDDASPSYSVSFRNNRWEDHFGHLFNFIEPHMESMATKLGYTKNEAKIMVEIARRELEYPNYFKRPNKDTINKLEDSGFMNIEDEDLTGLGLVKKMEDLDESEHGVEKDIYDSAKKQIEKEGLKMPSHIRRIEGATGVTASNILAKLDKNLQEKIKAILKEK